MMDDILSSEPIRLSVGGVRFEVEADTIRQMQSTFLEKYLDPDSPFQKPTNGIYIIQSNAESFSKFLHFFQFGVLPDIMGGRSEQDVLQDADFFGIRDAISRALLQQRESRKEKFKAALQYSKDEFRRCLQAAEEEKQRHIAAEPHHNVRFDDGQGRIYCAGAGSVCGIRDIDSRFGIGSKYTHCARCNMEIKYKPDLGWCHRCGLCKSCQGGNGCPNDCLVYSRLPAKRNTSDFFPYDEFVEKVMQAR